MKCCLMDECTRMNVSLSDNKHHSFWHHIVKKKKNHLMVETGALRILAAVDASHAFTSTSGCLSLMLHHKLTFFTFNFFLFHLTCFFYIPMSLISVSSLLDLSLSHQMCIHFFVRSESSAASVTQESY